MERCCHSVTQIQWTAWQCFWASLGLLTNQRRPLICAWLVSLSTLCVYFNLFIFNQYLYIPPVPWFNYKPKISVFIVSFFLFFGILWVSVGGLLCVVSEYETIQFCCHVYMISFTNRDWWLQWGVRLADDMSLFYVCDWERDNNWFFFQLP